MRSCMLRSVLTPATCYQTLRIETSKRCNQFRLWRSRWLQANTNITTFELQYAVRHSSEWMMIDDSWSIIRHINFGYSWLHIQFPNLSIWSTWQAWATYWFDACDPKEAYMCLHLCLLFLSSACDRLGLTDEYVQSWSMRKRIHMHCETNYNALIFKWSFEASREFQD